MIKNKITALFLVMGLLILSGAKTLTSSFVESGNNLIGTWNWQSVIDRKTNEAMGVEIITMGMATEVKTEFMDDNRYIESKLKKGSAEYSAIEGEWKLENNEILSLKSKDVWKSMKILKFSNDSILLEINQQMNLLMIKQK